MMRTFVLWMMFWLGKRAILGQEPPIYLRFDDCDVLAKGAGELLNLSRTNSVARDCITHTAAEELS